MSGCDARDVYAAFVVLGAANLIPWQANLALADYYTWQYGSNVMEFAFPAVSTSVLLTTCAFLVAFGARLSFSFRVVTTTIFMSIATVVVPIVDLLHRLNLISTTLCFWITILSVCGSSASSACAQNALYALASVVGDSSTQALQLGNGVVGLLAVLLRVLTMIGLNRTASMWMFCLFASGSLLLSLKAYNTVIKSDRCGTTLRSHEKRRKQRGMLGVDCVDAPMLVSGVHMGSPLIETIRLVWIEGSCVFLVFLVCLACFPGLTTSIASTSWDMGRSASERRFRTKHGDMSYRSNST